MNILPWINKRYYFKLHTIIADQHDRSIYFIVTEVTRSSQVGGIVRISRLIKLYYILQNKCLRNKRVNMGEGMIYNSCSKTPNIHITIVYNT